MNSIFKSNFVKLLISILAIVTTGTLIFISINNKDKKTDWKDKYEITIKIKSDNTYEILSSNSNAITNSNGKIEIINNTFGGSNNKAIRLGDKSFIVDSNNTITFSAGSGSSLFFLLFFIIR